MWLITRKDIEHKQPQKGVSIIESQWNELGLDTFEYAYDTCRGLH